MSRGSCTFGGTHTKWMQNTLRGMILNGCVQSLQTEAKSFTEQTEKCYLVNNNYLVHNIMIMF